MDKAVSASAALSGLSKFKAEQLAAKYALEHTEITAQTVENTQEDWICLQQLLKNTALKLKSQRLLCFYL